MVNSCYIIRDKKEIYLDDEKLRQNYHNRIFYKKYLEL